MSNPSVNDVLRSIPGPALIQLAEHDKNLAVAVEEAKKTKKGEKAKLSNADARKIIHEEIRRIAGKILVESMTTKQRADVVESLNIDHEAAGNNPKSSLVHKKRLLEAVEGGIDTVLKDHVKDDALVEIGEAFELDLKAKDGTDKLVAAVVNTIEYEATRAFLESFPNNILLDVAYEMKLCEATETAATGTVVEAILTQTELEKLKKPAPKKKAPKISKSKPKLAKGITYDDAYQWYSVEELKEFGKENDLIVSGTKKELIKRILAWFDGDKENTTHEGVKAAKEAKKAAKAAAKEGKEGDKKAPAAKKKAPAAKKEEPAAEQKAEEEAEAPVDLELDLDNLEKYDLNTLKAYCKEENIAVKGTKKANYIKAIEEYNNEEGQ